MTMMRSPPSDRHRENTIGANEQPFSILYIPTTVIIYSRDLLARLDNLVVIGLEVCDDFSRSLFHGFGSFFR